MVEGDLPSPLTQRERQPWIERAVAIEIRKYLGWGKAKLIKFAVSEIRLRDHFERRAGASNKLRHGRKRRRPQCRVEAACVDGLDGRSEIPAPRHADPGIRRAADPRDNKS